MDLLGIFDRGFWLFRSINTQPFLQLLILTRPVLQEKKNVLEVHFLLSGLHRYWPTLKINDNQQREKVKLTVNAPPFE